MTLLSDIARWVVCWICYTVYVKGPRLPFSWELALLPHAGLYAYSDSWADFRKSCAWNRAGRP